MYRTVRSNLISRLAAVLAAGGTFVAGVLTFAHARDLRVPCGASDGCAEIARHPSSQFLGIPVAVYGLVAYAVLFGLAALTLAPNVALRRLAVRLGLVIAALGVVASAYLTYVAVTQVQATCPWCLASASIMAATFLAFLWLALAGVEATKSGTWDAAWVAVALFGAIGGVAVQSQNMEKIVRTAAPTNQDVDNLVLEELVPDKAYFRGSPDAELTIVEFADFYCGTCRDSYPGLYRLYATSGGRLRLAFVNHPLFQNAGHEFSMVAAIMTLYARDKGRYWDMIDALFLAPKEAVANLEGLLTVAQAAGFDRAALHKIVTSGPDERLIQRVLNDMNRSREAGVFATPTYILFPKGGKPVAATSSTMKDVLKTEPFVSILAGADGEL